MVPGVWGTEEGVKEGKGGLPDSQAYYNGPAGYDESLNQGSISGDY